MHQNSSIFSAAMVIAGFTLLSAVMGLLRNRVLAGFFFGTQASHLDVYFAAFLVPDSLFNLLVSGALSAAFIPVYTQKLKKDPEEANHIANATMNSTLVFMGVLISGLMVFAPQVSNLIAHFPPVEMKLLAQLMRIMLFSQLFFVVSAFLTGIIQSHKRFLVPALAPVLYNVGIVLGTIVLAPVMGIYGAAIGVMLGAMMHMAVQIPFAANLGYKFKPSFDIKHPDVRLIRRLMIPRTATLAVVQLERWISVFISSMLSAGSLTMFNFARQLYVLPINLFGVSLGQASLPTLSAEAIDDGLHSFRKTLADSLLQIFFLALPAAALLLVLRIPAVRLVFGAREFPWDATLTTGRTLAVLTISIAPQAAVSILVRSFYAFHDTKTPLLVSGFTVMGDILLSVFFSVFMHWGIFGLALGTTIANTAEMFLLLWQLEKRVGRVPFYLSLLKMILATSAMGLVLWVGLRVFDQLVFDTTRTVPLIGLTLIVSTLGMALYLTLSYLLKIEQLNYVFKLIKSWGNWRVVLGKSEEIIDGNPVTE